MKFFLFMMLASFARAGYNPENYYVDYMTASDPEKSLIVYENMKTGKIMKFLVITEELQNPKAIEAIKKKVAEQDGSIN